VADSFLVQQMNNLAIAWFIANGAEETEAKLLTQRLTNGLAGHLLAVIAENTLPLAQLQKFVRLGNLSSLRDTSTEEDAPKLPERPTATPPLNLHREHYRARLLQSLSEPLLAEPFALKDLYIPLKGQVVKDEKFQSLDYPLQLTPRSSSPSAAVDLMEWAMSQLEDKTSITVIQGDPGCGKTSFCQMWASRVASELYPNWMPVLIRLGEATLGQTLEQTLESALPVGRFTDTDGWFSLNSPPCLLILDGLDELPRSPHTERYLWTFMGQVMQFHAQDIRANRVHRHKIILTSRRAELDCLNRKYRQSSTLPLPGPLQRIVIQPLQQEEFRQWFGAWAKLQSKTIAQSYFNFLKHGGVFQHRPAAQNVTALVTRPLMLYLVGILHRDAWIDESIFQMGSSQLKFEIYDRLCRWLLGEPAAGIGLLPELIREGLAHASRSTEAIANLLEGRNPQDLRHQMQVVALTIIQTGQYQVPQAAIQRLVTTGVTSNVFRQPLPALFFRSHPPQELKVGSLKQELKVQRLKVESLKDNLQPSNPQPSNLPLRGTLPFGNPFGEREQPSTFFSPTPSIEFSHPSFGEYLAAQEIATQLIALTRQVRDQYGEVTFVIQSPTNVAKHLYAVLGYGLLSADIEELVVERLRRQQKRNPEVFSFAVLFQRLYRFYRAYCRGQWMDDGIAHQAHSQLQALHDPIQMTAPPEGDFSPEKNKGGNCLNVLQIDAAVGLNVFVLLGSAAKEAQIPFWPCGNPDIPHEFDADQLLSFISRCAALSPTAFWQRARESLDKVQLAEACLNRAILAEANLSQANLSASELIGINLADANLQNTNLSWTTLIGANLSNANLSGANLEGADLSGANLTGANLKSTNLTKACLFQAQLDEQSKNFAIRSGAIFSLEEFQVYNQSLASTKIIANLEDDPLLEEEPTIFIESAEGELMLPDVRYGDEPEDDYYDGETAQIEDTDPLKPVFYNDEQDVSINEETVRLYDPVKEEF
jgi:hypothetical protein